MIRFFNEDVSLPFKKKLPAKAKIKKLAESENKKAGELNFIFCSDDYLLKINNEYLNHNYFTDVITFDYVENDVISGDIFISVQRVRENAEAFNVPFKQELSRVMYHGVLHLCGYADGSDGEEKTMREKENHYLNVLSVIE